LRFIVFSGPDSTSLPQFGTQDVCRVCCVLCGQLIPTLIWCNIFLHIYAINFLANLMHKIRNYLRVKTPERIAKHLRITSGLSM